MGHPAVKSGHVWGAGRTPGLRQRCDRFGYRLDSERTFLNGNSVSATLAERGGTEKSFSLLHLSLFFKLTLGLFVLNRLSVRLRLSFSQQGTWFVCVHFSG